MTTPNAECRSTSGCHVSTVTPANPWAAHSAEIVAIEPDYAGVATYCLRLTDPARAAYTCQPGQFNMLYLPGVGESAISVSGYDAASDAWLHTVRTAGQVTGALERLGPGGKLALRGPFGVGWPLMEILSTSASDAPRDLIFAVGGIGLAPLRMAIEWSIRERAKLGRLTLLYGARTPSTRLYPAQLDDWRQQGIDVLTTVDRFEPGWTGQIGVVPDLIERLKLRPDRTTVLTCGPEVMMRYTARGLIARGVDPSDIWLSMERNMQCAVGFCGHCQLGPTFICKDGPVFRYDRLAPYLDIEDL